MTFGAFAPFPLRLRDNETDGWTAVSHARYAADATAAKRTSGFAWLTYTLTAGVISGIEYSGLHGVNAGAAPTPSGIAAGVVTWTWPGLIADGYGMASPVGIVHGKATAHATTAVKGVIEIVNSRTVKVRTFTTTSGAAADGKVTLRVWAHTGAAAPPVQERNAATVRPEGHPAWSHDADIGDYGGDLDKEATATEETPYAWVWYRELGGMLGSSFSDERSGEVHSKRLTLARNLAGVDRAAERARNNGLPRTADETLGAWVKVLGVVTGENERRWRIRRKCAAQFASIVGPTKETIDAAIIDLLGSVLVEIRRSEGVSLSVPPTQTFWPGINPGPAVYSLGGGCWLSERSHLLIVVARPSDADINSFLRLLNIDLHRLLDRLLPAWAGHSWSVESDGFILDVSFLDLEGLTPS